MFVQCLLSYDVEVLKINIMKRSLSHLGTLKLKTWLFFLRVLENDVETGRKFCRAFGFLF